MKNLILIIAVFLVSIQVNAQKAEYKGTADTFSNVVESGVFEIIMPSVTEVSEIDRTSSYYTNYFTVNYNEASRVATITMVQNDAQSRRVINRFLLSNGVKEILFDGNTYNINAFFTEFLSQD